MNRNQFHNLEIQTPEGVKFSLHLAGPVSRFLAWGVDLLCIMVLTNVVSMVLRAVNIISSDIATAAMILAYFLLTTGYNIALEWLWRGQTVGKRLFRMRVMDARGLNLQLSQVVLRNLLRSVDSLPVFYMVGGLSTLISSHAQRLGDIAANTIVVRQPVIVEPDLEQLLGVDKYNSFRNYPHLCARLRHRVSAAEAGLAVEAILRRNDVTPTARLDLFRKMADHFKNIVQFPQVATEGISDEQYLRNIVDALFRDRA